MCSHVHVDANKFSSLIKKQASPLSFNSVMAQQWHRASVPAFKSVVLLTRKATQQQASYESTSKSAQVREAQNNQQLICATGFQR
jgi:hypothetical protein